GVLRATPFSPLPDSFFQTLGARPSAFIAYDGTFEPSDTGVVDWWDTCARWAARVGGPGYVLRGGLVPSAPPVGGFGRLIGEACPYASIIGAAYPGPPPGRSAMVSLEREGQAVAQVFDPSGTIALDEIRELLVALAARTRAAFVTVLPVFALVWDD